MEVTQSRVQVGVGVIKGTKKRKGSGLTISFCIKKYNQLRIEGVPKKWEEGAKERL